MTPPAPVPTIDIDPAPPQPEPTAASNARPISTMLDLAERYILIAIFAAVFVLFSFLPATSDVFASSANISTTIGNLAVVTVISLATVIPFRAGYLDLSTSAAAGLVSIVTAAAMSDFGLPLPLAIVAGIVSGVLIGAVNGLLVTRGRLDVFITTLGVATLLGGLLQWYTGGLPITSGLSVGLQDFGSLQWFGIPRLVFLLVPVVVFTWFVLDQTPFGRELTAIGSNARSATLVGIRTNRVILISFLLSGLLVGVAGVLLTARSGGADPLTGPGLMFPVLAAVFVGKTTIQPGRPNALGTVLGVLFVSFTVSGLSIAGVDAWVQPVFNGAVLVIAVALSSYLGRRRG